MFRRSKKIRDSLTKTRRSFFGQISSLLGGRKITIYQQEFTEHRLQERQLHLQGMLLLECGIETTDIGQVRKRGHGVVVDRYLAQRSLEGIRAADGDAAKTDPMRRGENHHAADLIGPRGQHGIGLGELQRGHRDAVAK